VTDGITENLYQATTSYFHRTSIVPYFIMPDIAVPLMYPQVWTFHCVEVCLSVSP